MFKKRTSKHYKRVRESKHILHLNVNSPRIVFFKSLSACGWIFKLCFVLLLLAGLGWVGIKATEDLLSKNNEFLLQKINLKTNGSFSEQRIVNVTRIKKEATLYSLDIASMEKELLALPEVIEVKIKRKLPNALDVQLVERIPTAWIHAPHLNVVGRCQHKGMLLGSEGYMFPCEGDLWHRFKNLPVIVVPENKDTRFVPGEKTGEEDILRALSLVIEHEDSFDDRDWQLNTVKIVNFYTLVADYTDDVLITFGMHDHERQLRSLDNIRSHAMINRKQLRWLDLRPSKNISGQYKSLEPIKVRPGKR